MINSRGRNYLVPKLIVSFIYQSTRNVISGHHQLCTFQARERERERKREVKSVQMLCKVSRHSKTVNVCSPGRNHEYLGLRHAHVFISDWFQSEVVFKKEMLIDAVTCWALYPELCDLLQS
jgi:Ulp1 family protease